jgi:hypothetical protein
MENQKNEMSQAGSVVPVEVQQSLEKIIPQTEISVFDTARMDALFNFAKKISVSSLIPEHYQNNPSNCFLAMWKSERMGMDFHSFMQVSYVLKGKFGYEAKFVIARLNTSGKFKGPIRWKADGEIKYEKRIVEIKIKSDDPRNPNVVKREKLFISIDSTRSWTAFATLRDCNEKIEQTFFLKTAVMNGWTDDPASKWNTMTEEKGQYQSAVFLGRMYAPEVIMDMQTREELENIQDAEAVDVTETGKDIFERGVEVSTVADPVLDPAMQVNMVPEIVKNLEPPQFAGNGPSSPAIVPEPQRVAEPADVAAVPPAASPIAQETPASQPAEIKYLPLTAAEAAGEPPVEPMAFKFYLLRKFTAEQKDLDVFLLSKKWLGMGETASDLSDSKIKNLRGQWVKFLSAYDTFKMSRKAGAA